MFKAEKNGENDEKQRKHFYELKKSVCEIAVITIFKTITMNEY